MGDHQMLDFFTGCLRLRGGSNANPHEPQSLLEYEPETHRHEALEPAHPVQEVADPLAGSGIGTMSISAARRRRRSALGRRGARRHVPLHAARVRLRGPVAQSVQVQQVIGPRERPASG